MIRRQINNIITLDLNLLHHLALGLNSDCFDSLLVDFVIGPHFLVVADLVIVLPGVVTAEHQAIIVELLAVVVITELVATIVAVKQQFELEAALLHHQSLSQTNSWLQVLHFYHRQSKLQRLCV